MSHLPHEQDWGSIYDNGGDDVGVEMSNRPTNLLEQDDAVLVYGNDDTTDGKQEVSDLRTRIYWIVTGLGCGWIMGDSIYLEVPWWQSTQPEGLKLASTLSLSGGFSICIIPAYLLFKHYYGSNGVREMWFLLIGQFTLGLFLACFWWVEIGNASVVIIFIALLSNSLGVLATVTIIPWIGKNANSDLIAAVFTGWAWSDVFVAILGVIQEPGKDRRFSPTVLYLCVCFIISISMYAFHKITQENIGLHSLPRDAMELEDTEKTEENFKKIVRRKPVSELFRPHHLWKLALPYTLLDCYVQTVCWVILRALLPFAAYHTRHHLADSCDTRDSDIGGNVLAYSIECSFLFLVIGSTIAMILPTDSILRHTIGLTIPFIVIVFAVFDVGEWDTKAGEIMIILCAGLVRFYDGFLSPQIFRIVGELDGEHSDELIRHVGIIEKFSLLVGSMILYVLVEECVIHP